MSQDQYLIIVGIRSIEFTYEDSHLIAEVEYFKRCYDAGLSAYKALTFFNDYKNGNYNI
jgi:hypothetical protein